MSALPVVIGEILGSIIQPVNVIADVCLRKCPDIEQLSRISDDGILDLFDLEAFQDLPEFVDHGKNLERTGLSYIIVRKALNSEEIKIIILD